MSELRVAELVREAQRQAGQVLGQAEPSDAATLSAGWARVLEAAVQVLEAMPQPTIGDGPAAGGQHYLTVRLTRMAHQAGRFHPLSESAHPVMVTVADTLRQAAGRQRELSLRLGEHGLAADPVIRAEFSAARVSIAWTVATLAHETTVSLRGYRTAVAADDRAAGGSGNTARSISLPSAERWLRMLQTHEELAIDYVNGHRGHLLAERPDPPPGSSDLGVRLALWFTVGVRAIADPHVSSADVGQIARTQASLAHTAVALTATAAHRGEVNPRVAAHLQQRMDTLATGWSDVAHNWSWLSTPDNPAPSPAVPAAAASLYTSVADATRSQARWATPDQIDTRLSGVPLVPLLRSITDGSQSLAVMYEQLPLELHATDRLRASAGGLRAIAATGPEQPPADHAGYESATLATPRPVGHASAAANRALRLNPPALQQVHRSGLQLARAADAAHEAVLVNAPHPAARLDGSTHGVAARRPHRMTPPHRHQRPNHPQHRPRPGPGITP